MKESAELPDLKQEGSMPIAEIAGLASTAKNAADTLDRLGVLEKV